MAEYEVLHAEPRHRVDEFVDELLGRARKLSGGEPLLAYEGMEIAL